jgi:GTP-binding protein
MEVDGKKFLLLDTAGLRRPGKVGKQLEFWSTVRTRHALERADVCAILIDAIDGITHQDLSILGEAVEAGKGIILCVNKFDLARDRAKQEEEVDTRDLAEVPMWGEDLDKIRGKYIKYLTSKVKFLPWVPVLFFSAKTGRGTKDLFKSAVEVKSEREKRISTAELNRILPEIFFGHVKPSVGTKMGKLKYCSQVTSAPPKFIFHVNNVEAFHFSYERYLENQLRERYGFFGSPIRIELRDAMKDKKK